MRIILIIAILSTLGCNEIFLKEIPLPETEPKLAVFCILVEGRNTVNIKVHRSRPVYGENPFDTSGAEMVDNARIRLRHISGNIYTTNTFHPDEGYNIMLNRNIQEGDIYRLDVRTPDGMNVYASTIIPYNRIGKIDVEMRTLTIRNKDDQSEYAFNIKFKDDPFEDSYYDIYGKFNTASWSEWMPMKFEQPFPVASDRNLNRNYIRKKAYGKYRVVFGSWFNTEIELLAVTRDYYLFHRSLNSYAGYYSGEEPFAEPTIMYSNIEGGLGLFSGVSGKIFYNSVQRN